MEARVFLLKHSDWVGNRGSGDQTPTCRCAAEVSGTPEEEAKVTEDGGCAGLASGVWPLGEAQTWASPCPRGVLQGRGTGKPGKGGCWDILVFVAGVVSWRRVMVIAVDVVTCVGVLRDER